MQIEMTERDRKLLVFLSIFVIVVCIGYWGIYPQIKSIKKMNKQIEKEEDQKEINEMKISELAFLEKDVVDFNEEISSARASYYPVMTSDQIDKYFTNMALDNNLYAFSLNINMPEEYTSLEPYKYSNKALGIVTEEVEEDSYSDGTQESLAKVEDAASDDDYSNDEDIVTGIYQVTVSMRLGGDAEALNKFVNSLSNSNQKHFISRYSYNLDEEVSLDENGEYTYVSTYVLDITIEIFMCEEFADGTNQ